MSREGVTALFFHAAFTKAFQKVNTCEDCAFGRMPSFIYIRLLILPIITLTFLLLAGCGTAEEGIAPSTASQQLDKGNQLQVHFLDVGQADSILLIAPNGQTILVDGGNADDGPGVVSYLKSLGIKELSTVVATHPHEDHIGGLDTIMLSYPPKQVYLTNGTSTTKTMEDFMTAVNVSGAKKIRAKAGVKLDVPGISGVFLAPNRDQYEDLNNFSAVLKITFSKVSFLFTGDAEDISEAEMLTSGQDLRATVLKVGHHGSTSSTSSAFLKAVSPKYSVISVGHNNDYGHPAQVTLNSLANAGVKVYRTDQEGTIVATSDGDTVKFAATTTATASIDTSPLKPIQPIPALSTGSLTISAIDLSGETVTIVNSSDKAVDLIDWKIVSVVGNQSYTFPTGTTLPAGGTLKVVSGKNAQVQAQAQLQAQVRTKILVWTELNIWNNQGDPGELYNAQGQLVSRFTASRRSNINIINKNIEYIK